MQYVDRGYLKKYGALPERSRHIPLIYMSYPNKMLCAACATEQLRNVESVIPAYVNHRHDKCGGCGKTVETYAG